MEIGLGTLARHLVREDPLRGMGGVGAQGVAIGKSRKMTSPGNSQDKGFRQQRLGGT